MPTKKFFWLHFFEVLISTLGILALSTGIYILQVQAAPILDVASTLVSSGTAPFDVDDTAGNDSNNTNNIVRTNDSFVIKYDFSVNGENATNAYIDINMPAGVRSVALSQLPSVCLPGSSISLQSGNFQDPSLLRCVIGNITAGTTSSFFITFYNRSSILPMSNGTVFSITPSIFANGSSATGLATSVVSSSQPRYNASFDGTPSRFAALGPNGEQGYLITSNLFKINGSVLGGAFGDKTIDINNDNYSFNINYPVNGGPYTGAVLYTWGINNFSSSTCRAGLTNGANVNIPCNQPGGAGSTVFVQGKGGLSNSIKMWIPATDVLSAPSQILNISLVVSGYDPNGIDGSSNFGPSTEPLNDNTSNVNIQLVTGSIFLKTGPAIATIGSQISWNNTARNIGNTFPLTNSILCDNLETSTQIFKRAGLLNYTYDMEYSTTPNTTNTATCDDSDGPWTTIVNGVVPLNIAESVTKVRAKNIVGGIPAGASAVLAVDTLVRSDIVHGSIIYNKGSFKPETNQVYINYTASSIVNTNISNVSVYTPNINTAVGEIINYNINQSVYTYQINRNSTTTVTSTLPNTLTYVVGSASLTTDSVVVNPDGTTTITWSYNSVLDLPFVSCSGCSPVYYDSITPGNITFQARIKTSTPSNTTVVNNVTISNTLDLSNSSKSAQVSTLVSNPSTFFIENTSNQNYTQSNQSFNYNIRYGNLTSNNISDIDLIDILPYNGDGLSPATNYMGTLSLNGITVDNGENILYTKAPFSSITTDPCDPTNILLGQTSPVCNSGIVGTGTTIWCPSLSGGSCPANNSEVTATRVRALNLPANSSRTYTISYSPNGNVSGNIYNNRVTGRASGLALVVYSNSATANVSLGSISGKVWNDVDQDGTVNNGESGIGSVAVTLNQVVGPNNVLIATFNTNSNGNYTFSNLTPGSYFMRVAKPAQTDQTYDLDGVTTPDLVENQNVIFSTLAGSNNIINVNFGYFTSPVAPTIGGVTINPKTSSPTTTKTKSELNSTAKNQVSSTPIDQKYDSQSQTTRTQTDQNRTLVRTGGESNNSANLGFIFMFYIIVVFGLSCISSKTED